MIVRDPLTEDEVAELWATWADTGDVDTRNRLACHYLPLVERIARRVESKLPPSFRADLRGFGVIGLFDAIDKFDADLGHRFETYSYRRIRGAMADGLRQLDWFPRGARKRPTRAIEKIVCVDFQARSGRRPSLQDSVADPNSDFASEVLALQADHQEVVDAMASDLPDRERGVIHAYYFERRTLADIAEELGVTESRVSQLHKRALGLLRRNLTERLTA